MGFLKIRAIGLKRDLDEMSTFLEDKSESIQGFEVISESKDYPDRGLNQLRRYFEVRFNELSSPRMVDEDCSPTRWR